MQTLETTSTAAGRKRVVPYVERDAYPLTEVANRMGGVSIRTVYNYIYAGQLRAVKIGGRRMVLKEDLAAFLANLRGEAA